MSGAARVSAAGVTSATTKELPTDATTGRCVATTTSLGAMPTQSATRSAGISCASDNGCGAAMVTTPPPSVRTSTRPAISSKRNRPSRARPMPASTQPVPTLGWPANGISAVRLKMRTRAVFAGSAGGRTKVVSLRLNSAASDCISPSLRPSRVGKHRQRIAAEAPVGEDVDRDEGKRAHHVLFRRPRRRSRRRCGAGRPASAPWRCAHPAGSGSRCWPALPWSRRRPAAA